MTTNDYGVFITDLSKDKKPFCVEIVSGGGGIANMYSNPNASYWGVLLYTTDTNNGLVVLGKTSRTIKISYFD